VIGALCRKTKTGLFGDFTLSSMLSFGVLNKEEKKKVKKMDMPEKIKKSLKIGKKPIVFGNHVKFIKL
jgi:hypothetical protein